MPNPLFEPLVPSSAIRPLQDELERRKLDQSVAEAQLKGFGSGALEGLRSLTSPAVLGGMAMDAFPIGRAIRTAPRVANLTSMGPVVKGLQSLNDPLEMARRSEAVTKYIAKMF